MTETERYGEDEKKNGSDRVRLDKWLWAARFYKTRAVAAEAVHGGHVQVNGTRAKPSRTLQLGDQVSLRKGPYEYVVHVCGLSGRRGPASLVGQLYEETPESRQAREQVSRERRESGTGGPVQRPDKRGRRQIVRFMRRQG
ncbi:RNA-binding protein [Ectothiorhodospiraceae bacterium 2226]|nr:RNA-binding protein [Ectothiorhodospiraceae bacterium 2226]